MSRAQGRERSHILDDLGSRDDEIRRLAVERLLLLPAQECIPHLVGCLGDESWRVRKAAVERLIGCSEFELAVDALIDALADGENPGRRNAAVEALVGRGAQAIPKLLTALQSDDADVRKLAVDAAGGIADASAREAMIETLADPDPNVRAAAADSLGTIGGVGAEAALRELATRRSEDSLVCLSALRALRRLEVPVAARDLSGALDDPMLRPAAFAVLGYEASVEATETLLKGLSATGRASREAAMEALLRILAARDGTAAEFLTLCIRETARDSEVLLDDAHERLQEPDLSRRLVLIQFLGVVASSASVVPILLAGADEAVAEVAHSTLEMMAGPAEEALDTAWPQLAPESRADACAVFARTRGERAVARLVETLDESDSYLRSAAARALGELRALDALSALVQGLEEAARGDGLEAEDETAALVDALACLASRGDGADELVNAKLGGLLARCLERSDDGVRLAVVSVLGRIGGTQQLEQVAALLKDESARVRRGAVEAVARIAPGRGSEPIRLALADESPAVRMAAAAALGACGSPKVLDDLRQLMRDEEMLVRAAAVRAIGRHAADARASDRRGEALMLLEQALAADGVPAMAALEALGWVGGFEAARAARSVLERGEAELVQAAIGCIGAHGDASALAELIPLVSHASWDVRAEAIRTLGERGVVRAVPPILGRLECEQDPFVRDAILQALRQLEG